MVIWVEGCRQPADENTCFHRNGNAKYHLWTGFFVYKGIISGVKRVEFFSDRMSYITFRGPPPPPPPSSSLYYCCCCSDCTCTNWG